jgi:phosphate starvation-inducible protein PhoH
MCPLGYMRGRTFKSALIIADEMQNSSPMQMLMLTTRLGSKSKLIITGDLQQTDKKEEKNGLLDLMNKIKSYKMKESLKSIEIIELKKEDIERSEIVEKIIEIYDYEEGKKKEMSLKNNNTLVVLNSSQKVYDGDAALIPLKYISKNNAGISL